MTQNEFSAGLTLRDDNSYTGEFRVSRDSALVVSDGHSRWYEQGARGQVFAVFTALTGLTLSPDFTAPPPAGLSTLLSVLNPVGSGVNLEIIRGWVEIQAGTPQTGLWAWCGAVAGVSITAAESGASKRSLTNPFDSPHVKVWSNTALTGGPDHSLVRPFPSSSFNGAITATTAQISFVDDVDGALVVLPGGLLTIAPALAITGPPTLNALAGIMYAEVPRSPRSI